MVTAQELGYEPGKAIVLEHGPYAAFRENLETQGYHVWSPADLMDARLGQIYTDHSVWAEIYSTDFGIAATAQRIFLFPECEKLRNVSYGGDFKEGGIPISSLTPAELAQGIAYDIKGIDTLLNKTLTQKDFRESLMWRIWLHFANDDQTRLQEFEERVYSELREGVLEIHEVGKEVKYETSIEENPEALGLYIPKDGVLRPLAMNSLWGGGGSSAMVDELEGEGSRLVGILKSNSSWLNRIKPRGN